MSGRASSRRADTSAIYEVTRIVARHLASGDVAYALELDHVQEVTVERLALGRRRVERGLRLIGRIVVRVVVMPRAVPRLELGTTSTLPSAAMRARTRCAFSGTANAPA